MPALAHLLCHWLLGAYAAWQCRHAPSLRQYLFGWPMMLVLTLAGLFLVPLTTFQARMYPSHAAGYAFNPEMHPVLFARVGPITLALASANMAALWVGFSAVRWSIVASNRTLWLISLALVGSGLSAYLVSLGSYAFTYGSYGALWDHQAASFGSTPSAWFVPLSYGVCCWVVAGVARWASDRPLHWP